MFQKEFQRSVGLQPKPHALHAWASLLSPHTGMALYDQPVGKFKSHCRPHLRCPGTISLDFWLALILHRCQREQPVCHLTITVRICDFGTGQLCQALAKSSNAAGEGRLGTIYLVRANFHPRTLWCISLHIAAHFCSWMNATIGDAAAGSRQQSPTNPFGIWHLGHSKTKQFHRVGGRGKTLSSAQLPHTHQPPAAEIQLTYNYNA